MTTKDDLYQNEMDKLEQTETELQSLRNQVSPHFLLNTLNNIYALVAFNPTKAQEAIQNLSNMLRHMLYQNRERYTTIGREVKFLSNYIDIMKLRFSDNVHIHFDVEKCRDSQMQVTPLLYISLVENAFKHGVGSNGGSIDIFMTIDEKEGTILAKIRNTNYPKTDQDKSGHGVGLQLVQRRLDIMYPGKYTWERGVDKEKNEYYSYLTLNTK